MNWAIIGAIIFTWVMIRGGWSGLFWNAMYVVALFAVIAICAMVFVKNEEVKKR
jgi:hypothetical protein